MDVLGIVENMSSFHCPHCKHEIDIFSKGGVEKTAKQFSLPFLGGVELDPSIRRGGDNGLPAALGGKTSETAKPFYDIAEKITAAIATRGNQDENLIKIM